MGGYVAHTLKRHLDSRVFCGRKGFCFSVAFKILYGERILFFYHDGLVPMVYVSAAKSLSAIQAKRVYLEAVCTESRAVRREYETYS